MNTWLKLDQRSLNAPKVTSSSSGVRLEVSLSPFDVPEAVRGFASNEEVGWFKIEFRYADSEDPVRKEVSETMVIEEGKGSGRLQAILVNVKKLNVGQVELDLQFRVNRELNEGLKRYFSTKLSPLTLRRQGMARQILNENSRTLLSGLSV